MPETFAIASFRSEVGWSLDPVSLSKSQNRAETLSPIMFHGAAMQEPVVRQESKTAPPVVGDIGMKRA